MTTNQVPTNLLTQKLSVPLLVRIGLLSLFTTFLVWLPFITRYSGLPKNARVFGFESIYRNYDGMLFVIPAKGNYRSDQIEKLKVLDLKPSYYAAHTPGYPLLIKLLSPFVGYLESMLLINVVSSIALGCLLYLFYVRFFGATRPLLLVAITLLLPRLWILRSTGSSEIVFLCCIISASLLLKERKYAWAAFFAAYASFTRIHGILFGLGICLYAASQLSRTKKMDWGTLLVGASAVLGFGATCLLYLRQYGDFFAYFHTGALVPSGMIYSQFDSTAKEIKTFFLEDLLVYFGLVWVYIFDAIQKHKNFLFYFVVVYFGFALTIQHRDLARYLLPIMPVLIGSSSSIWEKKSVRLALIAVLPAVYWYVVNFMGSNMFLDSMKAFM